MVVDEISGLTVSQAAGVVGVSPNRIRQLADAGKLHTVRTPYGRLFDRRDVEQVARERRQRLQLEAAT